MGIDPTNLSFSFWSLFGGLVFSSFGIYFIKRGRREAQPGQTLIGVVLLVFPYFLQNTALLWALGAGLLILAFRM